MNVPVNLDSTQVQRILDLVGPGAHGDFGEVDGDNLIADRLTRALELANAQEEERRATSNRIEAERRARIISTAADAQPVLDRIEDALNAAAELPADKKAYTATDMMTTLKRVRMDIARAQEFAATTGVGSLPQGEEVLERARALQKRMLVELLGLSPANLEGMDL